jgi:hypothetical protein
MEFVELWLCSSGDVSLPQVMPYLNYYAEIYNEQ